MRPKMAALKVAEGKLRVANAKLKRAQEELDLCQADLDRMQESFDEAMQAKHRIQIDAEATQKRMDAASRLTRARAPTLSLPRACCLPSLPCALLACGCRPHFPPGPPSRPTG